MILLTYTAVWKCLASPLSVVDNSYQHGNHSLMCFFLKFKKEVYIFNNLMVPKQKKSPSLHHNILQCDKWTWVWRGKERRAFSVTLVFEVKILWTGPENIFPRSQLKVHILPSQKWSFDQKDSLFLCGYRVWCWNCGFVLTTRWDSLQAPVSWTTTHTSNIQSDTNPWGKPCSVWEGKWINT